MFHNRKACVVSVLFIIAFWSFIVLGAVWLFTDVL